MIAHGQSEIEVSRIWDPYLDIEPVVKEVEYEVDSDEDDSNGAQ